MSETKTFRAAITAEAPDGETKAGTVEAVVSVFGNVDSYGDRMVKGAFSRTLAEWQEKGDPIPFVWSHDWDNPESFIGSIDPSSAQETDEGLVVRASIDLENPRARQALNLMRQRLVTQFSFGYIVRDSEVVSDDQYGRVREIKDVHLIEAGPTLLGANTETRLVEAASDRVRAAADAAVAVLMEALKEPAAAVAEPEQVASATETSVSDEERDAGGTIDHERLTMLLTMLPSSEE